VILDKWIDRLREARNRLVSDPRFQRWSLSNPITRPIARRRARAALNLTAGFVYSQILFTCVRLNIFEILQNGPLQISSLATELNLTEAATKRLLKAAASLDLLEKRRDGSWGLGEIGAALSGNASALALVAHQPIFYNDLADPILLLKGQSRTQLSSYWPYAEDLGRSGLEADQIAPYSALMAASQPMIAGEVLQSYDLTQHRCLMDVGGGEGAFISITAQSNEHLHFKLFDLQAVVDRARSRLEGETLMSRVEIHAGNFLQDKLPQGADIVTLIRIIHDHDDDSVVILLKNIRRSIELGAKLLIIEAMSGVKGAESLDAYYGFYTLAMGRGEPRLVEDIKALLRQAGFGNFRLLNNPLPTLTSILVSEAI